MYAVELYFSVDAHGLEPGAEIVDASVRRQLDTDRVRLEHVRARRVGGLVHVVVFVSAGSTAEVRQLAQRVGDGVAADLAHVQFSGFEIWTGERLDTEGVGP
jgi:hypothetical protein